LREIAADERSSAVQPGIGIEALDDAVVEHAC
jgi:hypothetical protein